MPTSTIDSTAAMWSVTDDLSSLGVETDVNSSLVSLTSKVGLFVVVIVPGDEGGDFLEMFSCGTVVMAELRRK